MARGRAGRKRTDPWTDRAEPAEAVLNVYTCPAGHRLECFGGYSGMSCGCGAPMTSAGTAALPGDECHTCAADGCDDPGAHFEGRDDA